MKAMLLKSIQSLRDNPSPLVESDMDRPSPNAGEVLIRVSVCGVCHTELDEIEGRTSPPELPIVLGHEVVGQVVETGEGVDDSWLEQRVGVAWIYHACGKCDYCQKGEENLCEHFQATGRDAHGGYAEFMVAPAGFIYPIPDTFSDAEAAPLLCAGAIGYRSLRLSGLENGQCLGLTGFGGSGHLVLKMAAFRFPDSRVYVFARSEKEREFALDLGAHWAGDTKEDAPVKLDAIIDTTPAWTPVVAALSQLKPGGRLVINAIRKEAGDQKVLTELDYPRDLWLEKEIKSVANVTRPDVSEFLRLAAEIPIKPDYTEYPLTKANRALRELKKGNIRGAKVLRVE